MICTWNISKPWDNSEKQISLEHVSRLKIEVGEGLFDSKYTYPHHLGVITSLLRWALESEDSRKGMEREEVFQKERLLPCL